MNQAPYLLRAIVVCGLLTVNCMLASCTTIGPISASADDGPLSGELRATAFTIEANERILVDRDLHIIADEQIVVLGELIGRSGATIELTAPSITINGTIQAGDGEDRDDVLAHGQNGGDIILNAPQIDLTDALLIAGRGGSAGPAGNGGDGGSIVLNEAKDVISTRAHLQAGAAGNAGAGINGHGEAARHGGNGGAGGGMYLQRARSDAR